MVKKISKRRAWTKEDVRTLKTLARKKTHAATIAKTLKRTVGATRQKALSLEFVARTRGPEISTSKSQRCIVDSSSAMRGACL